MISKKSNASTFLKRYGLISLVSLALSSCGAYSTRMSCPDSKGLQCKMMHEIDRKIDSGEIDKVYKINCNGKMCQNSDSNNELQINNNNRAIKAKVDQIKNENPSFTADGKYLIIKE